VLVCGSPKQERIVNSISDVGADGEYFVAGELMPEGQVVFGIDAASWPPLSRRWQVSELAAALPEGSLTAPREGENGGFLAESGRNQAFLACFWQVVFR
jgi:hypothetical protein